MANLDVQKISTVVENKEEYEQYRKDSQNGILYTIQLPIRNVESLEKEIYFLSIRDINALELSNSLRVGFFTHLRHKKMFFILIFNVILRL